MMKRGREEYSLNTMPPQFRGMNGLYTTNGCPREFLSSIPHPIPSSVGMHVYHSPGMSYAFTGEDSSSLQKPNGVRSRSLNMPECPVLHASGPGVDQCPISHETRNSIVSKMENERNQYPAFMPDVQEMAEKCGKSRTDEFDSEKHKKDVTSLRRIWPVMGFGKLDIREKTDSYDMNLDVPGTSKEFIDVSLRPSSIVVECTRLATEFTKGRYHYFERPYGRLIRTIQLPSKADPNIILCTYVDGVLSIQIGKQKNENTVMKIRVE